MGAACASCTAQPWQLMTRCVLECVYECVVHACMRACRYVREGVHASALFKGWKMPVSMGTLLC